MSSTSWIYRDIVVIQYYSYCIIYCAPLFPNTYPAGTWRIRIRVSGYEGEVYICIRQSN